MRQFDILISDECVSDIIIGRQCENDVTTISFDITEWFNLFGRDGTLVLVFQRPTDTAPYPINLVVTDNTAMWSVSATDCAIKGVGEAEIRYSVGGKVVKSRIYSVRILRALGDEITPPDPWEDWFEQVIASADRAEKAATEAQSAAESAESYSSHPPRIGEDGNWELWSGTGYVSTDYPSRGEKGETGPQGERGEKGDKGDPGANYVLTPADKTEIAEQAAQLVDTSLDSILGNGVIT